MHVDLHGSDEKYTREKPVMGRHWVMADGKPAFEFLAHADKDEDGNPIMAKSGKAKKASPDEDDKKIQPDEDDKKTPAKK